jgi:filamentous hemagglutinin family protein
VIQRTRIRCPRLPLGIGLAISALIGVNEGHGQVVLDGTLGQQETLSGPDFEVTPEKGRRQGPNLFHSFQTLNIAAGESATFSGPSEVARVFARVTGNAASTIDGTLRCTIPDADFYFVNPAGVLFGPNASLDIQGSFTVTTADVIRLADGGRFDATTPEDVLLTSAAPAAFGFLRSEAAGILANGSGEAPCILAVGEGRSLSMIGGRVEVSATSLNAPSGHLALIAVGSERELPVDASLPADGAQPASDFSPVTGDVLLSNGSLVDVSGEHSGDFLIRAANFIADSSFVLASSFGDLDGQDVDISVSGAIVLTAAGIDTSAFGAGASGDIRVRAQHVHLLREASLVAMGGAGRGGDVSIDADHVLIDGQGTVAFVTTSAGGAGRAGDIQVRALEVQLKDGGTINASGGEGLGGNIKVDADSILIDATDNRSLLNAGTTGPSDGGDISVSARLLQVVNGGEIRADTEADGNGGSIILAVNGLLIDGGPESLRTLISAGTSGTGRGGEVEVRANNVRMRAGGAIRADTDFAGDGAGDGGSVLVDAAELRLDGPASISAATTAQGRGGNINVRATSIQLQGAQAQLTASASGSGDGGNILLETDDLRVRDGASITCAAVIPAGSSLNAPPLGNAGTVTILSANSVVVEAAGVSTAAALGSGGRVEIRAGQLIRLVDGVVSASSASGDAGDIVVNTKGRLALLRSELNAQAAGQVGNIDLGQGVVILNRSSILTDTPTVVGGDVNVTGDPVFASTESTITAVGTVTVTGAPDTDITAALVRLSSIPGDAAALQALCGSGAGAVSSFVATGRGGTPIQAGSFIPDFGASMAATDSTD